VSARTSSKPTLPRAGGSSARGSVGFVSAGLELAQQVRDGRLPAPARLYVPVGTGGTLAGLVAGLRLAGLATRVVGVLVTDILPPNAARLAAQARATLRFLRRLDPHLPQPTVAADDFDLVREELGPGYGAATPAALRAVRIAAETGVALETTYTGKCLAALLARLPSASHEEPILFWNTYNAVDVAAHAPVAPDEALLPPRLRRLLARA